MNLWEYSMLPRYELNARMGGNFPSHGGAMGNAIKLGRDQARSANTLYRTCAHASQPERETEKLQKGREFSSK